MKKLVPILLLLFMCGVAHQVYAAPPPGLVGEWELCHDPDGDPKDVLRLNQDGTGTTTNADGRVLSLTYATEGSSIVATISIMNRRIEIPFSLSADKKKLNKPNKESGTTTTYVRKGNPDKFACSAK